MTKAQYGTPEYYRGQLLDIEEELNGSLDGETGSRAYAFAHGRLFYLMKGCIAHLESATASQACSACGQDPSCRPGCKYIQGHSGPCIERDLDAEVNAGKWGCANALDPATWPGEPEFVNVNHE